MKPKLSPNYPSTRVLIFIICAGLFLLAVGISNVSTVREGLTTGRVYSVAVVFGVNNMVYKSSSPVEYWIMMGIYSIACVGGIGFGLLTPLFNIRAYIRKLTRLEGGRGTSNQAGPN